MLSLGPGYATGAAMLVGRRALEATSSCLIQYDSHSALKMECSRLSNSLPLKKPLMRECLPGARLAHAQHATFV